MMKLEGFIDESLNVNIDGAQIAVAQRNIGLVPCICCGYVHPQFYICSDCGHSVCLQCLRVAGNEPCSEKDLHFSDIITHDLCPMCEHSTTFMRIAVNEDFIAQLRCHCRRCDLEFSLKEANGHASTCVQRNLKTAFDFETSSIVEAVTSSLDSTPPDDLSLQSMADELFRRASSNKGLIVADLDDLRSSLSKLTAAVASKTPKIGPWSGEYRVILSNLLRGEQSLSYLSTAISIGGTSFYFILSDGYLDLVVRSVENPRRLKGKVTVLGFNCPNARDFNDLATDLRGAPAVGACLTIGHYEPDEILTSFRVWVQLE